MPNWTDYNLEKHYQKHPAGKDRECWMELLDKKLPVTKSEYEAESISVIKNSWIQYCAEEFDPLSYDASNPTILTYHPERRYCADDRLIRTITEIQGDEIRTCFHEHFDSKHELGSGRRSITNNAERMLKFATRLLNRRRSAQLKQLEIEKIEGGLPEPIRLIIDQLKG